jgi:hypothetical protein
METLTQFIATRREPKRGYWTRDVVTGEKTYHNHVRSTVCDFDGVVLEESQTAQRAPLVPHESLKSVPRHGPEDVECCP